MATVNYPPNSSMIVSANKTADFAATNGYEYPVDTRSAIVNVTPPVYGSGAVLTAVVTAGAVTSVTVTNGGTGYTSYMKIVVGGPGTGAVLTPVINATTGAITSVTVTTGGTGYATPPALTPTAGPKLNDRIVVSDAWGSFATNPCIVLTSTAGNMLRGVAGDDIAFVESGMSECLVFTAAQGWIVSAGS